MIEVSINEAGYQKNKPIIQDIHFKIQPGELVGLLGPNGAGKSTTIQTMLNTLSDYDGKITYPDNVPRYAYIPEQPVYYEKLTMMEHFQLAADLFEMDAYTFKQRLERLLAIFKMKPHLHQFPMTFSKGMQQKVMIIQALLIQPPLYIIDEPFVGLDPHAIKNFTRLIQEELNKGASALMATHMLDTAERMCDRFLLMADGRLVADGTLEQLRAQVGVSDATVFDCFDYLLGSDSYET